MTPSPDMTVYQNVIADVPPEAEAEADAGKGGGKGDVPAKGPGAPSASKGQPGATMGVISALAEVTVEKKASDCIREKDEEHGIENSRIPAIKPKKLSDMVRPKLSDIWLRVSLRQDWGEEQDHHGGTAFDELFFDLVFVATTVKLSSHLKEFFTLGGLGRTLAIFACLWDIWTGFRSWRTTFKPGHTLFDRACLTVCMAGVVCTGIHIGDSGESGLTVGLVTSSSICMIWMLTAYTSTRLEKNRPFTRAVLISWFLATTIWLSSLFFPDKYIPYVWFMGFFVRQAVVLLSPQLLGVTQAARPPVNVSHMAERDGLWVMLILGEPMIVLVNAQIRHETEFYEMVALAFVAVAIVQVQYFESQPVTPDLHALRHSRLSGTVFIYAHLVLTGALICLATSVKLALAHYPKTDANDWWLLFGSATVVTATLQVIRLAHPFKKRPKFPWFVRILVLVITPLTPLLCDSLRHVMMMGLFALLQMALLAADLRGISADHDAHAVGERSIRMRHVEERHRDRSLDAGDPHLGDLSLGSRATARKVLGMTPETPQRPALPDTWLQTSEEPRDQGDVEIGAGTAHTPRTSMDEREEDDRDMEARFGLARRKSHLPQLSHSDVDTSSLSNIA